MDIFKRKCDEEIERLQRENEELKAKCAELIEWIDSKYVWHAGEQELLDKDPSLCLKDHDAKIVEKVVSLLSEYANNAADNNYPTHSEAIHEVTEKIQEYADKLKEETKDE